MRRTLNDEVLRALGHVRARVDAGHANETILHALAEGEFGALSRRLQPVLKSLQSGEAMSDLSKQYLRRDTERTSERPFRMLLTLLMGDGEIQGDRLDGVEREILEVLSNNAQDHAKRVRMLASVAVFIALGASVFVSVARLLIAAWQGIGEQLGSTPDPSATPFDPTIFYPPIAAAFLALLALMVRWR